MAIAYVGTGTASAGSIWYWFGNGPQSASAYTPSATNTMLAIAKDAIGTGKTPVLSSTVGSYTTLATGNGTGVTGSAFDSINVPNSAQVLTVDSSPTGDFMLAEAWEFSGVGSATATVSTASSSSTSVGAISGQAVVVPTGSMLYAVCMDTTQVIGNSPVLDVANGGTSVYDNSFDTLGITFAGSGASITPLFTARAATATNYLIFQFLLNPPVAGFSLSAAGGSYAINGQAVSFSANTAIPNLLAATGTYNLSFAGSSSDFDLVALTGLFAYAGYTAQLVPVISPVSLTAAMGSYSIAAQTALLTFAIHPPIPSGRNIMPSLIGVLYEDAIYTLEQLNIYAPPTILSINQTPTVTVKFIASNQLPAIVLAQSIAQGVAAPLGTPVTLTVSEYPIAVSVRP